VEAKLISGIDDHSRYLVLGKVAPGASARAVCTAVMGAMAEYGFPTKCSVTWPSIHRPIRLFVRHRTCKAVLIGPIRVGA
jgi:hypothetical protein